MNFAKRVLMGAGVVVMAAMVMVLIAPKAAHGLVAALVQVTNTTANPVPTVATDNPALQPFHYWATGSQMYFTFLVPTGKTLAIEHLYMNCQEPGHVIPTDFRLSYRPAGGNSEAYYFFLPTQFTDFELVLNQDVHLYAADGTTVDFGAGAGSPDGAACSVGLSGHLVNVP